MMANAAVEDRQVDLAVRGMHCAGCVSSVEKALQDVAGVESAAVNLATQRARVTLSEPHPIPATDALIDAIRRAGFDAELTLQDSLDQQEADRVAALAQQRRRIGLAVVLGAPVLIVHFLHLFGVGAAVLEQRLIWIVEGILTVGVLYAAAGEMLRSAWRGLQHGRASMDLLVAGGALTGLMTGLLGVWLDNAGLVIFDVTVMIVIFVAIGKYCEAQARQRGAQALIALAQRLPQQAIRLVDGNPETIPVGDVALDDLLRVPAHAQVPVDGEIVSGQVSVDEAMLTGESTPVTRAPGDTLFGGTRVVDGVAEMRATAIGATSAVARIAKLVRDAQTAKPRWQRFADRAASVFVPAVLLLAAATLTFWLLVMQATPLWSIERAIAVLVVACPCALGLAIPTAVLVGTSRAAERGILIREPAALEAVAGAIEVVVDKTGTLTLGRPALERIERCSDTPEDDLLRWCASVERDSAHPFGRALVRSAAERGLEPQPVEDFTSAPGQGVRGRVAGHEVVAGNDAWLRRWRITPPEGLGQRVQQSDPGRSLVWAAVDGRVAAALLFADQVHPEAGDAVSQLRRLGMIIRIFSGDRPLPVSLVAKQLKIKAYESQLSPEDKVRRIRDLVNNGCPAVMVGDGVNDAPALAAASAGIAIGAGTDVARESADICLIGHSPLLIPETIRIARLSATIMKQNLFWAVAYNAVMIPLAIFAPLHPGLATAAMMASSLTVVGNSLRLRRMI